MKQYIQAVFSTISKTSLISIIYFKNHFDFSNERQLTERNRKNRVWQNTAYGIEKNAVKTENTDDLSTDIDVPIQNIILNRTVIFTKESETIFSLKPCRIVRKSVNFHTSTMAT